MACRSIKPSLPTSPKSSAESANPWRLIRFSTPSNPTMPLPACLGLARSERGATGAMTFCEQYVTS